MSENSKKILRERARAIRKAIAATQRESDARALKDNVLTALLHKTPDVIGTYYPVHSEIVPPHELRGIQMALPVVRDGVTLQFYPWSPDMRLVKRNFDIPIPDTRGLEEVFPEVILMPLVACDEEGNRIGGGAGHYDRYVASRQSRPLLIGVCFDDQIWPDPLPAEPHDQRLDLIITPKRIIDIA